MNKLIVLINQAGTYKGGAQKRYLHLFKELDISNSEYYLFLNDALYFNCIKDGILVPSNRILHQPVLFEANIEINSSINSNKNIDFVNNLNNRPTYLRLLLGRIKYFLKCFMSSFVLGISIVKYVRKYNFKAVYSIYNGGTWTWLWLKIIGIKYIFSYNDTNFSSLSKNIINLFSSEYWVVKNAYRVDCLSPYIKDGLIQRIKNKSSHEYVVTPNSFINYYDYQPSDSKLNMIVFCSRLEKLKNPFLFVQAIDIVKEYLKDYKVIIIGNGTEFIKIKSYIKEHNLEHLIYLTGALSSSHDYITNSKIFISIQENNNYPSQSLLEAMACENAIIASDVGETRMLVTEKEGLLVNLSSQSIADAILNLIEDQELCLRLAKSARRKVTSKHTVEKFAEYFNKIMSYAD